MTKEKTSQKKTFRDRRFLSKEEQYINDVFGKENEPLTQIRKALKRDQKEGIHIGPYEGRILQLLMNLISAESVLEIGTLYGYSTLWMAYALPPEGKIISLEKNQENAKQARKFLDQTNVGHRVEILVGEAKELLNKKLLDKFSSPLHMVFIDADKAGYEKYLDWAEEHLPTNGLIVADNTFLFGNIISPIVGGEYKEQDIQAMKNFNLRLADTKKYISVLIPTSDGLTVAQKKF